MRAIGGPLSLGAEHGGYLQPKHFQAGFSYRYLRATEMFQGDQYRPEFERGGTNADFQIHTFDVALTYGLTKRAALTLNVPIIFGGVDIVSNQVHNSAGGLGDIRLMANSWIFNPDTHPNRNLAIGAGLKMPTGESKGKDKWRVPATGPLTALGAPGTLVERPLDPALQLGDGAWGFMLETYGFTKVVDRLYAYVAGSYLFNPEGKSDTEFTTDPSVRLSVPDMYFGRGGFSFVLWPSKGLSLSFGSRIEGVPVTDAIGGADDGFRRPGYGIYLEPGLAWDYKKNHFSLTTPVAVYRNREPSVRDRNAGIQGVGGMANFLIIASYSYQF